MSFPCGQRHTSSLAAVLTASRHDMRYSCMQNSGAAPQRDAVLGAFRYRLAGRVIDVQCTSADTTDLSWPYHFLMALLHWR